MGWRNPWKSLKARITIITSLLWLVSLWALAFTMGEWLLIDLRTQLSKNQESTVNIIAGQVDHEVGERIRSLEAVTTQITPHLLSDVEQLQRFLDGKPTLSVMFNAGAYITGSDGVALASVPVSAGRQGLTYLARNHVNAALTEGRSEVSDIAIGAALKVPVFAIATPIRDQQRRVIGCIVGVIDLTKANFLDNITNNNMGQTGGYLLVSRNQRMIVTATDKGRIMEQLAPPGVNPKIDFFLNGGNGSDVLVNPLGVEVLVSGRQITSLPWYVVAAVPTAEAFRPVWDLQGRMLLMALVLTLISGLLNWYLLRRQLLPVVSTIQTLSTITASNGPVPLLAVPRKDEIGELIESFNRLLTALEEREKERVRYESLLNRNQRLEALGLLAGGIAHDFNNLLAGIFGNVELALLTAGDGPAAPYLHKTLGSLGRAKGLTQQLITFSKGGNPDLRIGPLFPLVEDTARFALSGSQVSCRFEVDPDLWTCQFDRTQLGQVIENLVINAQQAMPQGGTIVLTARNLDQGSRFVQISVTDNGPGMEPDIQAHLFEPFFTTKETGHGLGLSTCYSIVHKHGGTIEVDSVPGLGTTFTVKLPAVVGEPSAEVSVVPHAHVGSGTILIMDDEPPVGEVLEEMLVALGYQVVRTESGAQAIAAYEKTRSGEGPIVAAILDLTVPGGMGGMETRDRLKALNPDLPIIVASGFSEAPVLADPVAFGFTAALRKPYALDDLDGVLALLRPGLALP